MEEDEGQELESTEPGEGAVCLPVARRPGGFPTWLRHACGSSFWLLFSQDALGLDLSPDFPTDDAFGAHTFRIRAGALIRIRYGWIRDDCLNYDPLIQISNGVTVEPHDAAVEVTVLPSFNEMARVYERTSDEFAFWKEIIASPDDDLPRLVYADWLQERGNPAAEFLRTDASLVVRHLRKTDGRNEWVQKQRLEELNGVEVGWRRAVQALRRFANLGNVQFLELMPGYDQIALGRSIVRFWGTAIDHDEEWTCLTVTKKDSILPPFVNYLLIQSAIAPLIQQGRLRPINRTGRASADREALGLIQRL
jgi:uncharacterized protein (TIGR02996 family)